MNAFSRNTRQLATLVAITVISPGCDGSDPLDPLPPVSSTTLSKGEFGFTTIDVPNSRSTTGSGINKAGDITGQFMDASGVVRGFVLRSGAFTTITYPGASATLARGIAPNGDIIGSYRIAGEPAVNEHGFLRTAAGGFAKADYPGHINTIAQRILPNGTILGCRHDTDFMTSMRGVVFGGSTQTETDAFASMHNGATPDLRRIVGLYTNMMVTPSRSEGYVIDNGVFSPLIVPGSSFTAAWDVNPAGEVAGIYRDTGGVFHGFVLTANGFLSIDVPGATATRAFGINERGEVVGSYIAGGKTFGFLARPTR